MIAPKLGGRDRAHKRGRRPVEECVVAVVDDAPKLGGFATARTSARAGRWNRWSHASDGDASSSFSISGTRPGAAARAVASLVRRPARVSSGGGHVPSSCRRCLSLRRRSLTQSLLFGLRLGLRLAQLLVITALAQPIFGALQFLARFWVSIADNARAGPPRHTRWGTVSPTFVCGRGGFFPQLRASMFSPSPCCFADLGGWLCASSSWLSSRVPPRYKVPYRYLTRQPAY